jgi:hypothetical protein
MVDTNKILHILYISKGSIHDAKLMENIVITFSGHGGPSFG